VLTEAELQALAAGVEKQAEEAAVDQTSETMP